MSLFGIFGGNKAASSSAATTKTNNQSLQGVNGYGNGMIVGDGSAVNLNVTDAGAIATAAEVTKKAIEASNANSTAAIQATVDGAKSFTKTSADAQKYAYTFAGDVQSGANNLVSDALGKVTSTIANALTTTQQATKDAMQYVFDASNPGQASQTNNNQTLVMAVAVVALAFMLKGK